MPMRLYDAYAAPLRIWGPWVNIDPEIIGGKLHLSISASSTTQMPGPFEGQIHYFAAGATTASLQTWMCPGATSVDVADSIQQMQVRFRAFANGFAVLVNTKARRPRLFRDRRALVCARVGGRRAQTATLIPKVALRELWYKVDDGIIPSSQRSAILERKAISLTYKPLTIDITRKFGTKGVVI